MQEALFSAELAKGKAMYDRILVVCVGNICRSPTAERILRNLLPEKMIDSAGISALVDKPADPQASKVAEKHGVSLGGHKARQLTQELCLGYDLILVMEKAHLEAVHQCAPETRGKVMLVSYWLENQNIADPYKRSDEMFEHVFQLIKNAAQTWQSKLQ